MSYIPMDWELTENPTETAIRSMEYQLYNCIVPQECFNRSRYCIINKNDKQLQQEYFERYNGINETKEQILRRISLDYLKRPYCWICYNNETHYNKCIIEYKHDIHKPSLYSISSNNYAGRFRAKACKHCNSIETQAKNITNIVDRFKYWSIKKKWTTPKEKLFYYRILQKYGYLPIIFK